MLIDYPALCVFFLEKDIRRTYLEFIVFRDREKKILKVRLWSAKGFVKRSMERVSGQLKIVGGVDSCLQARLMRSLGGGVCLWGSYLLAIIYKKKASPLPLMRVKEDIYILYLAG